ncbi:MAG: rRNA maturation RNase YbeY [Ferruginibacter sp.]
MINFYFQQTATLRSRRKLKSFLADLARKERKQLDELSIVFCSDEYLLNINREHLAHDYYTDIITFDLSASKEAGISGELYISIDRVKDNAKQFGSTFTQELHRVIFHGLLHLCGYKDKRQTDIAMMRKKEAHYLKRYFS